MERVFGARRRGASVCQSKREKRRTHRRKEFVPLSTRDTKSARPHWVIGFLSRLPSEVCVCSATQLAWNHHFFDVQELGPKEKGL
jgi:hypothetical protein